MSDEFTPEEDWSLPESAPSGLDDFDFVEAYDDKPAVDDRMLPENSAPSAINCAFVGFGGGGGKLAKAFLDLGFSKTILVNTENFQTNKKGIFAIGDICTYPGKEKLILSGFHEAALASVECFKRARPNEKYKFQFTTSSKEIQERLGCKPK